MANGLCPPATATKDKDGFVRVWDVGTGKELFPLKGMDKGVYAVAWSQDGERILTGGSDKTLRLWEAKTGKELKSIPLTHPFVYQVAFTPERRQSRHLWHRPHRAHLGSGSRQGGRH